MSIAWRIRLLAIGLVIVTSVSVGLVVYWGYTTLVSRQQVQSLEQMFRVEVSRLKYAFVEVEHDARVLSSLPGVHKLTRARRGGSTIDASLLTETAWKDQLASLFTVMLQVKPHYAQIRLIGVEDGGMEIVRVDQTDAGPRRVEDGQLQRKSDRPYYQEAIALPAGGVYFSPVDLNREQGAVVTPYQPMLRVASPVYAADGQVYGIVIVNLRFDQFILSLHETSTRTVTHYLANAEGDFIVHPDPSRAFGFDLGSPYRVTDEFPEFSPLFSAGVTKPVETMTARLESESGLGERLVKFQRVSVFESDPRRTFILGLSAAYEEVLLAGTPKIASQALGFTALLVLTALAGGYLLGSWVVRPLEKITTAARQITAGWVAPKLPVGRRDEIGALACAFDRMVHALHDNEENLQEVNRKLVRANMDLEHFAHIASHDLREPARRVAGLTDLLSVREQDRLSPGGRELIHRIQNASIIMLDQITDFREMANIGQGVMLRRRVRLDELISAVLDEFSKPLALRDVKVELPDQPYVKVYENLVMVLYRNLILNAIEHGKAHGIELSFPKEKNGSGWVFGVRNSGSRIAPQQLEKIFSPFARATGDTGRSGMGLSICKRIIERHAGMIWAESSDNDVVIKFTFGKDADVDQDRD